MATKSPDFIQIPRAVISARAIQPSDKFVFGFIYWFSTLDHKECTATNETLGEMSGLNSRSISNSIRRLKDAGFIVVKYSGDARSSKTKRTIKCLVKHTNKVTSNDVTRQQRRVTSNDVTRDIKRSTKEEKIRINKEERDLVLKMPDLTGDFYEKFALRRKSSNA